MEATVYQTADMDAASVLFKAMYTSMRLSARGPRQGLRLESRTVGRVRLDHVTFDMNFEAVAEPLDVLGIGRIRSGRVSYRQQGEDIGYGPGDICLALQPGRPWEATVQHVDTDFAFFDLGLLEEVATGIAEPVRLLAHHPISAAAGVFWWRTFSFVSDTVASIPEVMDSPIAVAQSARILAAATLATFPNTAVTDPTFQDRHDAHPDTLRRAIAFIEANPDADLCVADIAAASFVTIRAVQLAFRRHLGTTPMAYLRRVRLDRAHYDLLAADGSGDDTVTAIAARWGFLSPSAFTARYRAAYGQLPSQTLRQ